jgi:hypothetical protein
MKINKEYIVGLIHEGAFSIDTDHSNQVVALAKKLFGGYDSVDIDTPDTEIKDIKRPESNKLEIGKIDIHKNVNPMGKLYTGQLKSLDNSNLYGEYKRLNGKVTPEEFEDVKLKLDGTTITKNFKPFWRENDYYGYAGYEPYSKDPTTKNHFTVPQKIIGAGLAGLGSKLLYDKLNNKRKK